MRKVRLEIFSPVTNCRVIEDDLVDSLPHCVTRSTILPPGNRLALNSGLQCLQAIALLKLVAGCKLTSFGTKTFLYITSSQLILVTLYYNNIYYT